MRKLLLLLGLTLILSVSAKAQVGQPDCVITVTATTAGRTVFNNLGVTQPVCTTWHLTYANDGFSALSIELDEAPSVGGAPAAWVTWPNVASGTLPLTATTSGQVTLFKYFPWVSINITSVTGTGSIRAAAYGYRPFTSNDVNATPAGGSGTNCNASAVGGALSGNPCVVAGVDASGNVRTILSTAGVLSTAVFTTGADGVSNAASVQAESTSNAAGQLQVQPSYFNGVTWDRGIDCPNTSTFSVASTTTQVVPLSGSTKVRVCSFDINPSTVTAGSTDIVYGTGTNCATGITTLTGAYTLPAAAVVDITPSTLSALSPLTTPAGQAVCVRAVTSTVNGFIVWEQH